MVHSGHASAFSRYTGVDDFVEVATSRRFPLIFLGAILLEIHANRPTLFHQRRADHLHHVFQPGSSSGSYGLAT
jgi:hypothetical protein